MSEILKLSFNNEGKEKLYELIQKNISIKKGGVINFLNTRTLYLANKDKSYHAVLKDSAYRIADGTPLVWLLNLRSHKKYKTLQGPEFFNFILSKSMNISHFLLGDTLDVLQEINKKYKEKSHITGFYSPPFTNIENFDYYTSSVMISKNKPDIVWVALGSPKQDFVSKKLAIKFPNTIFINVGAAFRHSLGEFTDPPNFIKKLGLTGVFWRFKEKPIVFLKMYPKYALFLIKLCINEREKS